MTQKNRLLQAIANLLPAGALGASVALASATSASAAMVQKASEEGQTRGSVSLRLAEIRAGVSEVTTATSGDARGAGFVLGAEAGDPVATPTWWGNGGFGRWRLGWGNGGGWHNGGWGWRNGWHNGGWGNGWHNGGGWGNGWRNGGGWGNGWHNGWGNGWHNG